jgi:FRG domain
MERIDLTSWDEFSDAIKGVAVTAEEQKPLRKRTPIMYRGVSSEDHTPASSLERSSFGDYGDVQVYDYLLRISEIQPQVESLTGRHWEDVDPDAAAADYYDKDRWYKDYPYLTYLRHHGYPSPLLDWTFSPYIAAYFAFSVERSRAELTGKERVAIFALPDPSFEIWEPDKPHIHTLGPRVRTHSRHFQQQSRYTVCVQKSANQWAYAPYTLTFEPGHTNHRQIWQITLPYGERTKALAYLSTHNINAYSLLGGEEALLRDLYNDQAARPFRA